MATKIFLGEPPANIKQWIIDHATPPGPAGHADTIFTFSNGQTVHLNINGSIIPWKLDEESQESILDYDGPILYAYDLTSLDIGNTVTDIPEYMFNAGGLISVIIPSSVDSIGEETFGDNYRLTSVTFKEKTLAQVQEMENYPWGIQNTSIISVA